ncbi:S8 family serine peptidase [Streptomyces sp. NBC_00059]|uniref:S8 family serine peptidase n=1 Tax=Streptomyces sp. NBC_00059 TaxID=2975635 RepID=UPI00225C27A1|nr:S8 family serine peptidase [Streptomyces sp. NBC_00059]MCX5415565.1 S8 family serine peptidase [Streptomyces sp. NBC_00059]
MRQHFARRHGLLAVALTLAMGAPLLAAVPAAADPAPSPAAELRAKADAKVVRQLDKQDTTTFWVQLDSRADTSAAKKEKTRAGRDKAVIAARKQHAATTQAGIEALVKKAGAHSTSYWISNIVKVTGDKALAQKIAARPEVGAIEADRLLQLPDELPAEQEPQVDGVEWNLDSINVPKVWDELGVRGDGMVVANIDTGVDHQHATLMSTYRGLKTDGTYDHDHNWFDATASCSGEAPCDDHGHGTHTMGTMVGDDHDGNRIGVAPGARWIAAKACTPTGCPQDALLAAGQWILAPTDRDGDNPRPDLAPDVVNNSWGADIIDTWYKDMVQAWTDAGIFPAFSNGNAGPDCATAGSPGAYTNSYASGAYDSEGAIAYFSSRGTGEDGAVKPDIAAPGVDIRSAAPGGGYAVMSGTSMASPHTAATVALMWAASPAIRGDVAATQRILDRTAHDVDDTTCGGTAENNNVYGEGRLDAYEAVSSAPHGPLGGLLGTVTSEGVPVSGATVELDGPMNALADTRADGTYRLPKLMVGDYTVKVTKYGYTPAESTATVTEGATTTRDLNLTTAPTGTLSGTVRTLSGPEAGARIEVSGAPADTSTTTAADGTYRLQLPAGSYQVTITPVSLCATGGSFSVQVPEGDGGKDLMLPNRGDRFGTICKSTQGAAFPTGATRLSTNSDYDGSATVRFPFPVALYGKTYTQAAANIEGYLSFEMSLNVSANRSLPYAGYPNGSLYPFWDNLQLANDSGDMYWSARGTAPHREIVVEWRNAVTSAARTQKLDFSVVVGEDGTYSFHYRNNTGGDYARGLSATIGAENAQGTDALLYSLNQVSVSDGTAVEFTPTRSAALTGTVTDGNDKKALAGATVTVARDGEPVATGTTGPDGTYLVQTPVTADRTDYDVTVSAAHYTSHTGTVALATGSTEQLSTALATGKVTATPATATTVVVPAEQSRQRTIGLANSGSSTGYTVTEAGGAGWFGAAPAEGKLAQGGEQKVVLTFDTHGVAPGTVLKGTVVVASDSGRAPEIRIPVTVSVPAYRTAVDAGGAKSYTDAAGDTWTPDQKYTAGSYGFIGQSTKASTTNAIEDTTDDKLFRTAREGALEYRFDQVPNGTYQIELDFAELGNIPAGQRLTDVLAEGTVRAPDLDIVAETGGSYRALTKSFTVTVTDGQLNLRLVATGAAKTLVNAARVTQRPDLSS